MPDQTQAILIESDIKRLVERFYTRVREDELLGPIFNAKIPEEHWPQHLGHIQDFWSSVFLKTGRFKGNPLATHARLPGLTPAHFTRWLALFEDTAETVLEPRAASQFAEMANRIGRSLQMGIAVQHHTSGQEDSPFAHMGVQPPLK